MQALGGPLPRHLFAACFPSPALPLHERPWAVAASLDDGGLQRECVLWGSNAALFQPGVWSMYAPLMRADFCIFDSYAVHTTPMLPCPVTAWWASTDDRITAEHVGSWAGLTEDLTLQCIDGGHLFVYSGAARETWMSDITAEIDQRGYLAACPNA